MTVYFNENAHVRVCAHAVCLCITFALCVYTYTYCLICRSRASSIAFKLTLCVFACGLLNDAVKIAVLCSVE
jgi:hypothetical protein